MCVFSGYFLLFLVVGLVYCSGFRIVTGYSSTLPRHFGALLLIIINVGVSSFLLYINNHNNLSFHMVKTSAHLTSIMVQAYIYIYTSIYNKQSVNRTATTTRFGQLGCQKQTASSVANSPIRFDLNLASTHQMAPPKHTSDYSVATHLSTPKG